MSKVTEKDVLHLLEERVEKLKDKIKTIELVLASLAETDESAKPKLKGKEKKVIKNAKEKIKKDLKKNSKAIKKELAPDKHPHKKGSLEEDLTTLNEI